MVKAECSNLVHRYAVVIVTLGTTNHPQMDVVRATWSIFLIFGPHYIFAEDESAANDDPEWPSRLFSYRKPFQMQFVRTAVKQLTRLHLA